MESLKKYVSKRFEFAYPNKHGKVEMSSCTLIAEENEAENFDKFWNVLRSMIKAADIKELKIYKFKEDSV